VDDINCRTAIGDDPPTAVDSSMLKKNVLRATDITLISPQVQWFNLLLPINKMNEQPNTALVSTYLNKTIKISLINLTIMWLSSGRTPSQTCWYDFIHSISGAVA